MRHSNCRGQALVEAALVMIVFFAILIALFDAGQVFFVHQTLAERVSQAARYAAVHEFDADAVRNMVLYGRPDAPEGAPAGIFGITPAMLAVHEEGSGTDEPRVVVSLERFPFKLFTPFIAGGYEGRRMAVSFSAERP